MTIQELQAKQSEIKMYVASPHAYFKAFSRTARRFQHQHPSPRFRCMTLVGKPDDFLKYRPLLVHALNRTERVDSWQSVISVLVAFVVGKVPDLINQLSNANLLNWMVRTESRETLVQAFQAGHVTLQFRTLEEAFSLTQELLLWADVKLNEVIVQVDPFDDATWRVREQNLIAKRNEERRVLHEIDEARKRYAEEHATESWSPEESTEDFKF